MVHGNTEVNLVCKWCSYQADGFKSIEEHIEEAHLELQEPHRCDKCDFSAFHQPTLEAHIVSIHEQGICKFCTFVGSNKLSLTHHMKLEHREEHKKLKHYKCHQCDYETTNYNSLYPHKKMNH